MKKTLLATLLCSSAALAVAQGGPMKIKTVTDNLASYADKTVCVLGTTAAVEGSDNAAMYKLQDDTTNTAGPSLWLLVNGSTGTYKAGDMVAACGPLKASVQLNNKTYAPLLTALSHAKNTPPKQNKPIKK